MTEATEDFDIENQTQQQLAETASKKYDADIIQYSGDIDDEGFGRLVEVVLEHKKRRKIILVLRTNGGSANSAYQIARFLQKVYAQFILFAPSYCYSAGTLVALGAHRLIVTPFTELGPLDVQLYKQNEIGARKSGLLTHSAFEGLGDESFELFEKFMLGIMRRSGGLVSFRVAADVSASMVSGVMAGVYSKIDPDVVGGDRRDLEVALHYGTRLIQESGNSDLGTLYHLVNHYPSHDCIIDDDEVKTLFQNVEYPSNELMLLSAHLGRSAYGNEDETFVVSLSSYRSDEGGDDDNSDREECEEPEGPGYEQEKETGSERLGDRGDSDRKDDSGAADSQGEASGAEPARGSRRRQSGGSPG